MRIGVVQPSIRGKKKHAKNNTNKDCRLRIIVFMIPPSMLYPLNYLNIPAPTTDGIGLWMLAPHSLEAFFSTGTSLIGGLAPPFDSLGGVFRYAQA